MTETQRRIRAYQKALPELRERVVAVALLLVMSASMLTSASFAWLTISRRPEVSGVSTTVAANGNLEIALATSETEPDESKVGDSSATKGQSITAANVTWGNLVNLSDESYGLQYLTLRPAMLNTNALLTSPLYSAVFTQDGRVEKLDSNFSYTSWTPPSGTTEGYFGLSESRGVRAISSTKIEAVGYQGTYLTLRSAADSANAQAAGQFMAITKNDAWMKALANMMGIHMTANLNSEDKYTNAEVDPADLQSLIDMYAAFIEAFETEAAAMANLLNLQLFVAYGGDTTKYSDWNADAIMASTPNSGNDLVAARVPYVDTSGASSEKIAKITNMKTFLADYKMLVADKAEMERINASGDRRWTASGLNKLVSHLVNIDNCLLQFSGEEAKTVSALMKQFSSNMLDALGYMNAECTATITNGVLYNFEQRVGGEGIKVTQTNSNGKVGLPIAAKMYVTTMNLGEQSATVYATIVTSATKPSDFQKDLNHAVSMNTGAGEDVGEIAAEDTYGLAIDLWVKTNAEGSYLTLEGNVLTKEEEVDAKGRDASGNEVNLYTLTRITEVEETNPDTGEMTTNSVANTYDLYKIETKGEDNSDVTTWYRADTFAIFELQEGESPKQKKEVLTTVIGFEGENRVWDRDQNLISTDATTQGSGSCYVFYADTPEDQARSLELLKSMYVAFVSDSGSLLAKATMDVERSYEESGRVIVPLVLDVGSTEVGPEGNRTRVITALEQNTATLITAIVYLDGTMLSNENVLAAADIQGQLNIQFGSNTELQPIDNETLQNKERSVSASIDISEFQYDTHVGDMKTRVSLTVAGDEPNSVTGFFLRQINSTQGSRESLMTFTKDEATGTWISDYVFTAPGNYILRTVLLDGQEYVLKSTPTVTIHGFTVESLVCTEANNDGNINIMTAENFSKVNLTLRFASSNDAEHEAKMPSTVQGRFLREDGTAVNVTFNYDSNTGDWKGSATFLASGEYDFQYLILDGDYSGLPEGMWQHAVVNLGMKVAVYTTSPTSFKYLPLEITGTNKELLGMRVAIMDSSGSEMIGLKDAELTYCMDTSYLTEMDTNLTWDASLRYYTGELKTLESGGPGTWVFKNVKVGGSTITNATISPEFTMISPEPPSYAGITNKLNYYFAPDGDAFMQADIKFSATAKAQAIIADANGREYPVMGERSATNADNVTTWQFKVPAINNNQNGTWTMKEIRVWNYFDKEGNEIKTKVNDDGTLAGEPGVNFMVIDVTGENYTMKVVQSFTAEFKNEAGNQNQSFSGAFLDTYSFEGIHVDIYDFEGEKLPVTVSSMKLAYDYDGKTQEYGGYTSTSISAQTGVFELSFAADPNSNGTRFVQSAPQSIQYAGNYKPASFTFTVGSKTYTFGGAGNPALLQNIPTFTVESDAPTVKVTGTNPARGTTKRVYSVKKPTSAAQAIEGDFFSFTDYRATVYIYTPTGGGSFDQEAAEADAPTVTLALSGVPAGYSNATMEFITPNSDSNSSTFTFTNGTATAGVGKAVDGEKGLFGVNKYPECYPAGTMTQDKINIVYNEISYTVTLSNEVTIDQPQSPTALVFAGIPESYEGERPGQVIGKGSLVTVTLPEYYWTARIEEPKDGTWSAYTSAGEVAEVNGNKTKALTYTSWIVKGTCSDTTYYTYQYFTWTKFQSSITAETDIYTQGKKITKWVIDGKTYNAGETISVSGNGIITATAVVNNNGSKTFVETKSQTTYKYLYGYVAETKVTKTESAPDLTCNIVGTVGNTESAALTSVKIANVSNANASTGTLGTNTTTDSAAYASFWP